VIVLGLNAYHGDAAAALLVDGELVAAVEEERFTREKHQAGFPAAAARWCLQSVDATARDIDHVAVSRDPTAHIGAKLAWTARHRPSPSSLRQRGASARGVMAVRPALAAALDVEPRTLRAKFHRVEHHRAHMASAFLCSPFDDATCVSIDGMGDFTSSRWGRGRGAHLAVEGGVRFPHSLGVFYTAFTQFLGLPAYGDEYKLMGLAAYGEPHFLDVLRDVVTNDDDVGYRLDLDWFVHHDRGVDMTWAGGTPRLGALWSPRLEAAFGPARQARSEVTDRDRDLAASVQARLEEVELEMLRRLHTRTGSPRLTLAGGVALNCVVNGRIPRATPFRHVWVQPAANDAGTAIGGALWVWHEVLGRPRSWTMTHAYLGPAFDDAAQAAAVKEAGLAGREFPDDALFAHVAARIAAGAVVGWYQGATEFGPRALGNRSIVADPRRADMKDTLNARIKFREPFRPFAPSVLAERSGDWFDLDGPSPYMVVAGPVRAEQRPRIPAVTHEDGTARVQTVAQAENPRYHALLRAFEKETGVPVLLNTSLNENEPIVCRPEEAIDCFLRTEMDVLVVGNTVLDRAS